MVNVHSNTLAKGGGLLLQPIVSVKHVFLPFTLNRIQENTESGTHRDSRVLSV